MKKKIVGVTVGTTMNPQKLGDYVGNGKSAYDLAVKNGFKGTETEWLASLNGKDGYTPVKDKDYFDGVDGKDGKDGKDGYTPIKGIDYFDGKDGNDGENGKDGTSVTVSRVSESSTDGSSNVVTFSDGKTLTVKNGNKGSTGDKGDDGKTPVKGVDYFTEADKAEIVNELASEAPVKSVNGKTGDVKLSAVDVGARASDWMPSYSDVGAEKNGTSSAEVGTHNTNTESHNDIRLLIEGLTTRLNALANSDDTTLDQMKEVVDYIKANRDLIEQITTNKVGYSDIVDNLATNVSNKPLSAAQGVALKALIDAITVPTKLSELSDDASHRLVTDTEKSSWNAKSTFSGAYADLSGKPTIPTVPSKVSAFENDVGYLKSYTETDPTVPSWAKASTKPSYSKSEVGLGNVDNVKQYSASNPPPYPVMSVNGNTGAVTVSVPTKTSQLTNDSNFAVTTKAETWTFTLADGSTVTKKVVLA